MVVQAQHKISTSSSSSAEAILERDFRDTVLLNIPPRPTLNNINNNLASSNNSNPNSSSTSGGSLSQSLSDCEENLDEDFKSSTNNLNIKINLTNMTNGHGEKKDINSSLQDKAPPEEVDFPAGSLVRQWVNGTEASYNQLIEDLEDEHLTKENFTSWMSKFWNYEDFKS